MELNWTEEFRAYAVRIALTSGLTCKLVASDLGVTDAQIRMLTLYVLWNAEEVPS
ncbi:transposase [Leisingera sp. MMG026]|uniref:transposase n=1 Tax=Leisingera sp. MMG026 TaxID=2909982 RepID=UPI0031BA5C0D